MGLIQYARGIFMDQHGIHMKPTLSQHSTSNPVTHCTHQHPIQVQMQLGITSQTKFDYSDELNADEENDDTEEEGMSGSDTNNTDTERNSGQLQLQMQDQLNMVSNDHQTIPNNAVSSELMQCEMSEVVRDGCSNNILEDEIQMLMDCQNSNCQLNLQGPDEPCHSWHFLCEELQNDYQPGITFEKIILQKHPCSKNIYLYSSHKHCHFFSFLHTSSILAFLFHIFDTTVSISLLSQLLKIKWHHLKIPITQKHS